MQTISINFQVPQGWHELGDKRLRYVYELIAGDYAADELKLLCLLRWSDTKVIGKQASGAYLLKKGKMLFEATPLTLAELLPHLDWLSSVPTAPVRLSKINRRDAIAADLQGVPFETYIICDNLYQGYLQTQNDELLDQLADVLYPGSKTIKLKPEERISIFYWMAALKDFFSRRYSDFLQPATADNANMLGASPNYGSMLQEAMDAQIRALTKGDVTKENEILALDTWRALTELNAQAKEYKQLQAATKK